jgi:sialic acid synthase SpsE
MLSKLRFSLEQWKELKSYADSRGILLFSTVNTPKGIELAQELKLEAFKLSSWDYNYLPLWQEIAELRKPLLIDTGPVELLDVAKVMNVVSKAGNDEVVLLHCFKTSKFSEMNMLAIPYMREAFGVLSGFSAVGQSSELDILALGLGACVLEKRVTMSRSLPGHHHVLAKEPKEFIEYCQMVRNVHAALGVKALKPSPQDLLERRKAFRRIVANRSISAGELLTTKDLACKRPEEGGLSPEFLGLFIGRRLKRGVQENEAIQWEDIE